MTTASRSAIAIRMGSSRQNDRFLRLRRPVAGVLAAPAGGSGSASPDAAAAVSISGPGAVSAPACASAAAPSAVACESASDVTADPESRSSDAALSCGPLT